MQHRRFYTQTLLRRNVLTHTDAFTYTDFFTQESCRHALLHTDAFTHYAYMFTQMRLHTDAAAIHLGIDAILPSKITQARPQTRGGVGTQCVRKKQLQLWNHRNR